jgi:ketosteroid isomerase-like protein
MKTKLILILMISMALVFVSCENDSQPLKSISDIQNVETQSLSKTWQQSGDELGDKLMQGMVDGDIDVVMSCFWNSPDFIFVSESGVITRGWDNMKAGVTGMINATESRKLTVQSVSRFRVGDEVYSVGIATWELQIKEGPKVEFQEVWTDVAKKVKGNWVYLVDHAHDLTPFP